MEGELIPTQGRGMIHVDPDKEIEFGTKAANALKKVVDQAHLSKKFGGDKEHLFFEAWQTIGQFYRATPKVIWTKPVTDPKNNEFVGFEARAEILQDDKIICAAEASCMRDEPNWKNKPMFQLKSMAQTRAMAKALRSCFAWIVVLAGYAASPAEEMQEENAKEDSPPDEFVTINQVGIAKKGKHKDGTEWILYSIDASDGERYGTFSSSISDLAEKFKKNNTPCTIVWEKTDKGNKNIKEIQEYKI